MTSGSTVAPGASASLSGAPEVSRAYDGAAAPSAPRTRDAMTAYTSWAGPGGTEPANTSHEAPAARLTMRSTIRSTVPSSRAGPGSLILVVVPSGSVTVMFVRMAAPVDTLS